MLGDKVQVMNAPPKGITDMERENTQAHESQRRERDTRKKKRERERNVFLKLFLLGPLCHHPCQSWLPEHQLHWVPAGVLISTQPWLEISWGSPLQRPFPPPRSRFKSARARRAEPRAAVLELSASTHQARRFCRSGSPTAFLLVLM